MPDSLEPGMFVSELDRPWSETNFLMQGFTIEDQIDISSIKDQCAFVYVDFKDEVQYKRFQFKNSVSKTYKNSILTESEKQNFDLKEHTKPARKVHRNSAKAVKTVVDKVMLGEDFQVYSVRNAVKDIVREVLTNEQAMMMMILLKQTDSRIADHSLNVSILALGFARFLGYSGKELEEIGIAAMLHDIGKSKVDLKILEKKQKLTKSEITQLCLHTKRGYDVLMKKRDLPPLAIDVVLNHHERLSGQGYPRGLKQERINKKVRLVSIVDAFEAMTSEQPHKKARSVVEAYKLLMEGKGTKYDEKLVLKFIEWRGIYPPGTVVEMKNGEVGIVVSTNQKYKLKPRVLLVLDEDKQPRRSRLIHLATTDTDAESKPYVIFKAFENEAFGVKVQDHIEQGLIIANTK